MLPEHISSLQQTNGNRNDQGNNNSKTTIININKNIKEEKKIKYKKRNLHLPQHQQQQHRRIPWLSFQDNLIDTEHRRGRRIHGLQLPLHPLQVFGWFILIIFGIISFAILIPSFIIEIQQPLYGLLTGLYIIHIISHFTALLTDPADRELRRLHRNDRIVPEFDRNKHSHVIENGRCHLCNIKTTSNRTKHCSVCNKCVGKFDHHCKWLNHCIGGRNYVAFLMCVVSAVIASMVILAASIAQILLYHIKPEWLNFWYILPYGNDNSTASTTSTQFISTATATTENIIGDSISSQLFNQTYEDDKGFNYTTTIQETISTIITNDTEDVLITTASTLSGNTVTSGIGLHNTIFLVFIGFLGVLAAITAGLLLHLCFFHIYISFLGLTTYEYIRNHRQNAAVNTPNSTTATTTNNTQQNPSKLTSTTQQQNTTNPSQIFFCSNLKHPAGVSATNIPLDPKNNNCRPTTLHCCENSREYHQTSSVSTCKTYYMCSLLEETSTTSATNANIDPNGGSGVAGGAAGTATSTHIPECSDEKCKSKTFHCCSQFQQHHNISSTSQQQQQQQQQQQHQQHHLSPPSIIGEIESSSTTTTRSFVHYSEQCTFCTFRIKTPTKSDSMSLQDKRCCLKTITKHHRWKRKWNCCSNVPDSPDVPNDIITSISTSIPANYDPGSIVQHYQQQQHHQNHNGSSNATINLNNPTQIPAHYIKTNGNQSRGTTKTPRPRLIRPWPVTRFRHMLRMIGRYRRPRCRHGTIQNNLSSVKQNQVRPVSSDDSSSDDAQQQHHHQTIQSIETILPTSVIRDEFYTGELTMPTLPPPPRRKIPNPTDLDELAETLGFSHPPTLPSHRFTNSSYRRPRRKNLLRTRSPTLSPIHESGLSNPTSPQPCRHSSACSAGVVAVSNICGNDVNRFSTTTPTSATTTATATNSNGTTRDYNSSGSP